MPPEGGADFLSDRFPDGDTPGIEWRTVTDFKSGACGRSHGHRVEEVVRRNLEKMKAESVTARVRLQRRNVGAWVDVEEADRVS